MSFINETGEEVTFYDEKTDNFYVIASYDNYDNAPELPLDPDDSFNPTLSEQPTTEETVLSEDQFVDNMPDQFDAENDNIPFTDPFEPSTDQQENKEDDEDPQYYIEPVE